MDMSTATLWWIATGLLVASELATGTFYLLMLALGAAAAALAAHLGLGFNVQMVIAALIGGGAVALWHRYQMQRRGRQAPAPSSHNADVLLDIGQTVHVTQWNADLRAQVKYRGSDWQARFVGHHPAQPGLHRICGIEGSCLLLDAAA